MRVLFALNSYEDDGPGNLVFGVCKQLRDSAEVEVGTVALSRGGEMLGRYEELGISAKVINTRGGGGLKRLREWARSVSNEEHKPDIIHSHLLWPDLAVRLTHKQLGNISLVSTCHGLHALKEKGKTQGFLYGAFERATRSRCRAWIAVSQNTRDEMIKAGYPDDCVHVVRNGVDSDAMKPLDENIRHAHRAEYGISPVAPFLVAAGNLRRIKGHDVLLRAMPSILREHPETMLVIFGEGELREELQSLAYELNIEGNVRMPGHFDRLPEILASADVVVHPSRVEAYGLVVAEAQSCGTPVVASRIGGIPEVVEEDETGYLVSPDSPDEIARRVNELFTHPARRQAMGVKAREYTIQNHSISKTAEGYLRVWREVVR